MKSKLGFVDSELGQIKQNHLYRKLKYGTTNGSKITIQHKNLINLCSNDYLGIPTMNMKIKQMQSSSRLVSGNDESYQRNYLKGKYGAIPFVAGFESTVFESTNG